MENFFSWEKQRVPNFFFGLEDKDAVKKPVILGELTSQE